ncbi:MAG: hypothetical protein AAF228_05920 [Pseudomonadota bacterium]
MGKFEENQKLEQVEAILNQLKSMPLEPDVSYAKKPDSKSRVVQKDDDDALEVQDFNTLRQVMVLPDKEREPDNSKSWFLHGLAIFCSFAALGLAAYQFGFEENSDPAQTVRKTPNINLDRMQNPSEKLVIQIQPVQKTAITHDQKIITQAKNMLQNGQIIALRKLLLHEHEQKRASQNADIMLLLAKSYDSKVLRSIPSADAEPNLEEANLWYRNWKAFLETDGSGDQKLKLN